jgi:hypothetical protein
MRSGYVAHPDHLRCPVCEGELEPMEADEQADVPYFLLRGKAGLYHAIKALPHHEVALVCRGCLGD